jgi:hypothetical protein
VERLNQNSAAWSRPPGMDHSMTKKHDGDGLTIGGNASDMSEKNSRCRSYTPRAGEEGNSTKGRWGGVDGDDHHGGRVETFGGNGSDMSEKLSLQDPYPPCRSLLPCSLPSEMGSLRAP